MIDSVVVVEAFDCDKSIFRVNVMMIYIYQLMMGYVFELRLKVES